jgi:hypothetical protein
MKAPLLWTAVVAVLHLFAIPATITVEAYRAPACAAAATRRQWLIQILPSAALAATATTAPLVALAAAADTAVPTTTASPPSMILRSKGCYQGQGEACDELAESNALIQALQLRSAANRDQNERVRVYIVVCAVVPRPHSLYSFLSIHFFSLYRTLAMPITSRIIPTFLRRSKKPWSSSPTARTCCSSKRKPSK